MSNDSTPVLLISFFGEIGSVPESSAWSSLLDEIRNLGVVVWEPGNLEPSHFLAIDYSPKLSTHLLRFPKRNRWLCVTEPIVVNPRQFSRLTRRRFSRVLMPSSLYPRSRDSEIWEGGILDLRRNGDFFAANDGNRQGYGMVNQNKFSMIRGSNYALRARLVRHAAKNRLPLRVAGADWDRGLAWTALKLLHHMGIALAAGHLPRLGNLVAPLSRSSRQLLVGAVGSDVEFLSRQKIALVIENESSYVSEKIFAAFRAGCQCVYVGPPLSANDFPKGFLFQAQANVNDILHKLVIAAHTPYEIDVDELRNWINESAFARKSSTTLRSNWIAHKVFNWMKTDTSPHL